ncbi:unnamed protein product, partial [Arctogadus glacialis]
MPSALCPPGLQGATDLEKHLELLVVENERLKQELKACRTSAAPPPAPPPGASACPACPHGQVSVERDDGQRLGLRLQECEEELARQAAAPPPVKYVTQTVEVENAQTGRALAEARAQSGALTDQLHESQRSCIQ